MFTVFAHIAYEGMSEVFRGDRDAVKAWLKGDRTGLSLDDLEIYSTDAPDVYALFGEDACPEDDGVRYQVEYETGMGTSRQPFPNEPAARAFIRKNNLVGGCVLSRIENIKI